MITAVIITGLVLLGLLALWVAVIARTGNSDAVGGSWFVAFVLGTLIVFGTATTAIGIAVFRLIWS